MNRWLVPVAGLLALTPICASADDASYCGQLSALAYKFVSGGGGDGRTSPDLNTIGAIEDCRKGNYARGIPYLEKRLRDSAVTLPPRS
jgi:hypothetical protein